MLLSLVIAVVFGVLAVFFANDNQMMVQVNMLGLQLEGKLGIVIVLAFALGALTGIVMMLPAYLAQGWALIRSRRKVEDLERGSNPSYQGGSKQV
jgi:uncharacterized membrane protein YciS (DUF1049 family)